MLAAHSEEKRKDAPDLDKSFSRIVETLSKSLSMMKDDIKKDKRSIMIMIDGPAGVGKSTFTSYLTTQLKHRLSGILTVTVLPQNLFAVGRATRNELHLHACSDATRGAILFEKMDDLITKKAIVAPSYNPATGERVADAETINAAEVIISEDVSSLGFYYHGLKNKDQVIFRIFIQPQDEELLRAARKKRDTAGERGVTAVEFDKSWNQSIAYNWIFTYRGRENANIVLIRQTPDKDGVVPYTFMQVAPVIYQGQSIQVFPRDAKLMEIWKKERDIKLLTKEVRKVYREASKPVRFRMIETREVAKSKALDKVLETQGFGNVISIFKKMEKPESRENPFYVPMDYKSNSQFVRAVLSGGKVRKFNPSPIFNFNDEKGGSSSVLTNMLEPSTQINSMLHGLSNLEATLLSRKELKGYLEKRKVVGSESEKILQFQQQLKAFYMSRFYFRIKENDRHFAVSAPTTPYFNGQILISDLRGDLSSVIAEKEKVLQLRKKIPQVTRGDEAIKNKMKFFRQRRHSFSEAEIFLAQQQHDMTLSEAKLVQLNVTNMMKKVHGHASKTDAVFLLQLLSKLNKGDVLGQNSQSAITDAAVSHIQCFNESDVFAFPIFNVKRNTIGQFSGGICWALNFPATAFLFELDKIDDSTMVIVKKIQEQYIEQNALLPEKERSDFALISRINKSGKFELVFILRKDLTFHQDLNQRTIEEKLVEPTAASNAIFHRRPGFVEMSGCFFGDCVEVFDKLTEKRMEELLRDFSASEASVKIFASIVQSITPTVSIKLGG